MTIDKTEHYIGDGLYVRYDGFAIWLRAPHPIMVNGEMVGSDDHLVALEPQVLRAFIEHCMQIPRCRDIIRRTLQEIDHREQAEL